ncbi:MAG: DUF4351 domain-containing protein, partial [Pigmentiphaga sp.]
DRSYRQLFSNPTIVKGLFQDILDMPWLEELDWARHVLLPRALPEVDLSQADNLLEIKTMLTDHTRSWTHQWKTEGRVEGRAELLHKLLTRKFGPLPANIEQRLNTATSETLEIWSLNLLDAKRLEEVFEA